MDLSDISLDNFLNNFRTTQEAYATMSKIKRREFVSKGSSVVGISSQNPPTLQINFKVSRISSLASMLSITHALVSLDKEKFVNLADTSSSLMEI